MSASRHFVHFIGAGVLNVAITAPTSGSTVISATPLVTWSFTGGSGVQSAYRLAVYSDAAGTVNVYDSSYVASAVQQANIPVGVLQTGVTYYVRVQVVDSAGAQGQSVLVDFITAFATSGNVLGLRAGPFGTRCIAPDDLPRVRLTWTQVVPGAGETFVRYDVRRSEDGGATWITLAQLSTIGTTEWTDDQANGWTQYNYAVVYVATSGASTLISAEQVNIWAMLDFDHAWLHALDDPADRVRLDGWAFAEETADSLTFDELWGLNGPRPRIGDRSYRRLSATLADRLLRDRQIALVRALQTAQRDRGTLLCFRHGRSRERLFCSLVAPRYAVAQKTGAISIQLVENDYTEAVAF